jgi:hypothetical protein
VFLNYRRLLLINSFETGPGKEMPSTVPESWPGLIGFELNAAIQIISNERPDVRIARVLPPGRAPSPPPQDQVRVIIYNTAGPVPDTWMVVAPAPYIG